MKRSLKLIGLVLAVAMLFSLTACGTAKDTSNIKIGSIGPLTGSLAVYGTAVANAEKLAIEEINAAGGVLGGRKLEVVAYMDDKKDSTEAANAYNKLVGQGVVAIIGSVTSGVTQGLATLADKDKMLLLTPTATNDDVTKGKATVFRACYADSYQSSIAAKFIAQQGKTKVAILYASGDAYSSGMRDGFKKAAATLGLTIVKEESSSSTSDTDFSTQLTNIQASGAEAIFVPYYYDAVGPYIVPQARAAGFTGMMVGADGWDGTEGTMIKGKESLYNNTFFTNHYAADDPAAKVQKFVAAYKAKYNGETPNALAALGYDSVYMLKQAIEKAGSAKTADIVAAMKTSTFDVVTGKFTFDANNTPTKPCAIIEYKDGKLVWKATVQ